MVLVIDDDPDVWRLVVGLLRSGGEGSTVVRNAGTLHDGLALAAERRPLAVFLDLRLPDANGLEAVNGVRRALERTPIIVLTADGDRELAVAALRQGADDFLLKSELTATVVARVFRYAVERAGYRDAMARSEERAAAILDAMKSPVALFDGRDRPVSTNRAWRSADGEPLRSLCALECERGFCECLAGLGYAGGRELAGQIVEVREGRLDASEGEFAVPASEGFARVRYRVNRSEEEKGLVVVALEDVTKARAIEEDLVERDHRLALALEAGRLGAWDWDIRTGALRWNRRHEEMWGYAVGEFDGTFNGFMRGVHPEDRVGLQQVLERAMAGDGIYRHDFRVIRRDGRIFWTEGYGRFMFDSQGRPTRMAGVIRDATAERLAKEEFLGSQRLAALGELAAGVAHDLGNLIGLARNGIESARRIAPPSQPLQAAFDDLALLTEQGAELVRSLLGFASPAGAGAGHARPIDLGEASGSFVGFLRRLLPRGLRLVVDAPTGAAWVSLQPIALRQVLMNLVLNANDALGGRGEVRVRVEAGVGGGPHLLEVSDDGPGVSEELRERIFEPFVSGTGSGSGHGLGLAIVRSIVEDAGGSAEVGVGAAGGVAIRLLLPAAFEPVVVEATDAARAAGGPRSVAVIDGNRYVRSLLADGLRESGMSVEEWGEISDLVGALERGAAPPQAVLVAVEAGARDGVQRLRAAGCRGPVVVLAAAGDERTASEDAILLRKPLTVGVVRDAVQRALASFGGNPD